MKLHVPRISFQPISLEVVLNHINEGKFEDLYYETLQEEIVKATNSIDVNSILELQFYERSEVDQLELLDRS